MTPARAPARRRFRYGTVDDAETIAAYHHRCLVEAFIPILPADAIAAAERLTPTTRLGRWQTWLAPGSGFTTVVADLDGTAIGHVVVRDDVLAHLFVDPAHWRTGLGQELLAIGERILGQRGQRRIRLQTMVGNAPAIALYESTGWAMTDELVDEENDGMRYQEHVLVKDLEPTGHVAANRAYWDEYAPEWLERGRRSWSAEPHWGEMQVPESEVGALPELAGRRVVELGCGTGYVSAWCLRAGAALAVGLDNSAAQLRSARALQTEFDLRFPLLNADAERAPLADGAFDVAISEYGAAIWCDPYRWIPEAARVLRPGGDLVFLGNSTVYSLCLPDFEDEPVSNALLTPQRGMHEFRWPDTDGHEFHLAHGDMIRLLRANRFEILDLIELYAPETGPDRYSLCDRAWARRWPVEEIWIARRH